MRLQIEVEFAPNELPHAARLLDALRELAPHVKTKTPSVPVIFQPLVARLADGSQLDSVALEVNRALKDNGPAAARSFVRAFLEVAFNKETIMRHQTIGGYMALIPRLEEPARTAIWGRVLKEAIKHLKLPRASNAQRIDFFAQAEAFASLLQMNFIPVTGAMQTISRLLLSPPTRCAAVTMLGKSVELCLNEIVDHCIPSVLAELAAALGSIKEEEEFQYDVNYIEESFGWQRQVAAPERATSSTTSTAAAAPVTAPTVVPVASATSAAGAPLGTAAPPAGSTAFATSASSLSAASSAPSSGATAAAAAGGEDGTLHHFSQELLPHSSSPGHQGVIYAMAYNEERQELVTGGKDGLLIFRDSDGVPRQSINVSPLYACSIDFHSPSDTLFACGFAKDPEAAKAATSIGPSIFRVSRANQSGGATSAPAGGAWLKNGTLSRPQTKLVTAVKCFSKLQEAIIFSGESVHNVSNPASPLDECLCIYDLNASSSFDKLEPVIVYREHKGLIAALAPYMDNSTMLLSGSQDLTVRMWDRRLQHSIGIFGSQTYDGSIRAHNALITCVECLDAFSIISASMDGFVHRWDVRMIQSKGTPPVSSLEADPSGVLKVACGVLPHGVAISTVNDGLFLSDWSAAAPVKKAAQWRADSARPGRYYDLKWVQSKGTLFTGGIDGTVDSYVVK